VPDASTSNRFVVIARDGLKLRAGPSTDFNALRTLPSGTLVSVISREGMWGLVDLEGDGRADNNRARRYVAKYTINPAISQGISGYVGSIEVGKLADLCIWDPVFFGVKPDMVLKRGTIAAALMGDPNASIPTPQPEYYRPMFGAYGRSMTESSVTFVSQALMKRSGNLGLAKKLLPVTNTRKIGKRSMVLNGATPRMEVNAETYEVRADGRLLTCPPAKVLPMAQRYFMY